MFIHVPINFQQWSLPLETILSTFWSSNWAGWVTNVYRAAWHCWTSAPTEGGERRGSGLDILYDIICTHTYCGIIIHIFAIYIVDFCYICLNTQKNTHECFESRCYPKKVQGQQLCFGLVMQPSTQCQTFGHPAAQPQSCHIRLPLFGNAPASPQLTIPPGPQSCETRTNTTSLVGIVRLS